MVAWHNDMALQAMGPVRRRVSGHGAGYVGGHANCTVGFSHTNVQSFCISINVSHSAATLWKHNREMGKRILVHACGLWAGPRLGHATIVYREDIKGQNATAHIVG